MNNKLNVIKEKLKTLLWFAVRPRFWIHASALILRKLMPDHDSSEKRSAATAWAKQNAASLGEGLTRLGIQSGGEPLPSIPDKIITEANILAENSKVAMGGAGALDLLYSVTVLLKPGRIVETGVAYGWSSLAFLLAMDNLPGSKLISVDMPYPKMNNEPWVGVVVPKRFQEKWTLIREPDRHGLTRALKLAGGYLDICHYDSDKSYWGRKWAYPILWKSLRSGGVFISDDIQDNFAFREFVEEKDLIFSVVESQGKYVGITVKP